MGSGGVRWSGGCFSCGVLPSLLYFPSPADPVSVWNLPCKHVRTYLHGRFHTDVEYLSMVQKLSALTFLLPVSIRFHSSYFTVPYPDRFANAIIFSYNCIFERRILLLFCSSCLTIFLYLNSLNKEKR